MDYLWLETRTGVQLSGGSHVRHLLTMPKHSRTTWALSAAALAAALAVSGCASTSETDSSTATPASSSQTTVAPTTSETPLVAPAVALAADSPDAATSALDQLQTLPVKGRAPKTGYSRDLFGQAWSDDVSVDGGRNGCDTRNDILRRDLTSITLKPGSNGCTVLTGVLDDTYTGATIAFTRGQSTSSAVQVDHVVALSDAWQKGAQQLDETARRNFANDPRNLQAVDGPANQQKSDSDAASWLPPNKSYRCTYVARQVEVKAAYSLWVTQAEKDAITRVLGDCGGTAPVPPAPIAEPASEVAPPPAREEPAPAPAPAPVAPAPAPSSVYYANCAAARAAGVAPIYVGQPGYRSALDRDNDGVACE